MANQTSKPSVIQTAWERRQTAYAAFQALPDDNRPVVNGHGPGERELWDKIDTAEEEIRSAIAQTPGDVMLQLWCAMYHCVNSRDDDAAASRGDFEALAAQDSGLDWPARLMLAAIRSLKAMEGR